MLFSTGYSGVFWGFFLAYRTLIGPAFQEQTINEDCLIYSFHVSKETQVIQLRPVRVCCIETH